MVEILSRQSAACNQRSGLFWWKDVLILSNLFCIIAKCTVGDDSTVLFWDDAWTNGILANQLPRLVTFAKNTRTSVKETVQTENIEDIFLPLSEEAFVELETLQQQLDNLPEPSTKIDSWSYIWGNARYSSQRLYKLAFQNTPTHPAFKWVWKASCMPRIKFFAWLI